MTVAEVRRADPEDATAIAELASATFRLACPPHTQQGDIDEYVATHYSDDVIGAELTADGTVYYVAAEAGELVGFAMLIAGPPPGAVAGRNPVELRRIYVTEAHHGSGVAAALLDECVRHARTHGYDLMWLGTNKLNHRGLAFYAKHGFAIVGSRTFTVGGSVEDDHVLTRPLDDDLAGLPDPARA